MQAEKTRPDFRRYLEVYETTEGWFNVAAAGIWNSFLNYQSEVGVRGHMLEVGVHHGKSAALLAMHADPEQELCLLVDKFLDRPKVEDTLSRVRGRVDAMLKLVCCDSRSLPSSPMTAEGRGQFRFYHIDGEHTAGAIYNDLELAHSLMSEAGIVCLDDFFSWWYPQNTEAVFRYLNNYPDRFTMFLCGFNKAFLARPHFVNHYLEFCRDRLLDELEDLDVTAVLTKTTYPAEMNCFGIGPRGSGPRFRGPDWATETIRI